ncbi:MAG TPA: tRNA (adenosine(37)-N6)-threonylcarbamoyltransferase complex dimerization subunit type 1 TsaB [Terriglobales bacterium]|nr:tRNA (adenosine(37)-N6)-threonylcarbamoyltransferase complex dimerization subunit type 1 TsaB [Terriglobales bacterium]
MFLFAADTSGKNGSIALARGNRDGTCDVLEVVPLQGGTFSAQLIPQMMSLLSAHQVKKADLGAFAVVSGPGSFTGLRVGLAAVKALAEVLGRPIVTVSLLEAVAWLGSSPGTRTAVLDAGRNEAYVGRFRISDSAAETIEEKLIRQSELHSALGTITTSDQKIADAAAANGVSVEMIAAPRADSIARIGWKKLLAGTTVAPESLDANYIRRSDAEIFSKPNS